jgi:hypothetical protein
MLKKYFESSVLRKIALPDQGYGGKNHYHRCNENGCFPGCFAWPDEQTEEKFYNYTEHK